MIALLCLRRLQMAHCGGGGSTPASPTPQPQPAPTPAPPATPSERWTVAGRVVAMADGRPIGGAKVTSEVGPSMDTDAAGAFRLGSNTNPPFTPHAFTPPHRHRLSYLDEGAGDPVVMLHGNPTWSFYFRNIVLALRDSHRCIVPDHIGCGLSAKPPLSQYDYSLKARVDDVEALFEHLEVTSNITLIVHDWGGMIGMAWAARRPERVARLVLMNTAAFRIPAGKALPRELALARSPLLGPLLVRGFDLFVKGAVRRCTVKPLAPAVAAAYRAPHASWGDRLSVLRFVQDIPLSPSDPSWPSLEEAERALPRFASIPTLLCWGMRDFVFDGAFLDEWTRRLPGAEVHRFEDAGHWLPEDAGDRIVPLVRRFLEAHPA